MNFLTVDRRLEGKSTLRQCQLTQLYLLGIFDEICRENNLKYFIDFGTLLGALRHNGFIPWDDDLDVTMPWDDYCKFLKIAPNILPANIVLPSEEETGGLIKDMSRLRDTRSFYYDSFSNAKYPSGIFIDIYPMKKARLLPKSLALALFKIKFAAKVSMWVYRCEPKSSFSMMTWGLVKGLSWQFINLTALSIEKSLGCFFPRCWLQSCGPVTRYRPLSDSDIFPLRQHLFEGISVPIPAKSEEILTRFYGEWQKLPPENERFGHHYNLVVPTISAREINETCWNGPEGNG